MKLSHESAPKIVIISRPPKTLISPQSRTLKKHHVLRLTPHRLAIHLPEICQVSNKKSGFDRRLRQSYARKASSSRCHNIQSLNSWKKILKYHRLNCSGLDPLFTSNYLKARRYTVARMTQWRDVILPPSKLTRNDSQYGHGRRLGGDHTGGRPGLTPSNHHCITEGRL